MKKTATRRSPKQSTRTSSKSTGVKRSTKPKANPKRIKSESKSTRSPNTAGSTTGKKPASGNKRGVTKASKRTDSKQTDGMLVKLRAKSSSEKKKREQAEKDRARKIAERKRLEAGKEAKKKAQRAKDKKGVRHCILTEVPEFVDIARQEGKIPFIIDHERKYSRFNEYQNVIPLMMKKYIVEVYVKKGMTKEEAREEMREKLISSMKHGSMLQIDLGETAPDLLKDFCGLETFPTELVLTPGSLDELENVKPLLREQDYDEHGIWAPRGKIEVVVTTDFAVAEYAEFLEDSIPLNKLSPIHIMPEAFRK